MAIRQVISAVLMSAVLLFSGLLNAQDNQPVSTISVPFEFWVDSTRFPAGDYVLDSSQPAMIIIRTRDGKQVETAATLLDGEPVADQDARAIFILRDGRYQLVKIWSASGKQILTGHYGEDGGDGVREVKITHSTGSQTAAVKEIGQN
jgi:hypothetical protein